jgi:hypothetical protein
MSDMYWPVLVTRIEEHILWVPGVSAEDAAARHQHRDPTDVLEKTRGADTCVGGGVTIETLSDLHDPYEYNEQYGPRLPDGSFWGPATLAIWAADRAARLGGAA